MKCDGLCVVCGGGNGGCKLQNLTFDCFTCMELQPDLARVDYLLSRRQWLHGNISILLEGWQNMVIII